MTNESKNDELLESAKALVAFLEKGEIDDANQIVDDITRIRETELFQELGKLTRQLHDALNNFNVDSRLSNLAEQDIPDARQRLTHVINMTNEAADKTLSAVETSIPICETILDKSRDVRRDWGSFLHKEMSAEQFRVLTSKITEYLESTENDSLTLKDLLTDVLMAQTYQDLTGQIIKRVIELVGDVEDSLVNMIKIAGTPKDDGKKEKEDDSTKLEGPQVPGLESADAVTSQDEVDDLLSSLGF